MRVFFLQKKESKTPNSLSQLVGFVKFTSTIQHTPSPNTTKSTIAFNHSFITLSDFTPNIVVRADTIPLSIYSCL